MRSKTVTATALRFTDRTPANSPARITVITDSSVRTKRLKQALQRHINVQYVTLPKTCARLSSDDQLIVWADLKSVETIFAIRRFLDQNRGVTQCIFLIEDRIHPASAQAYALGATHVLIVDQSMTSLHRFLRDSAAHNPDAETEAAAQHSAQMLEASFTAMSNGELVDIDGLQDCADSTISCLNRHGLSGWLGVVRRHHKATYQHVLLVSGVLVDFGISLGLRHADLRTLHLAAMLHDIGKAKIPLSILDKPGRLEPQERLIIERHPSIGFDALQDNPRVTPEILDGVRHHHEYLDGTGYPDRLSGTEISDIVRMLTIADIFGALIEERSYKPPMPRQQAYNILLQMTTRLETPLVSAFETVALER